MIINVYQYHKKKDIQTSFVFWEKYTPPSKKYSCKKKITRKSKQGSRSNYKFKRKYRGTAKHIKVIPQECNWQNSESRRVYRKNNPVSSTN